MSEVKTFRMQLSDVIQEYPMAAEWLSEPTHETAQISQRKEIRLPSALEKIEAAGGKVKVNQTLAREFQTRDYIPLILYASTSTPMILREVYQYALELGIKSLSLGAVITGTMPRLEEEGLVTDTDKITYMLRPKEAPETVLVQTNRIGFRTTKDGLEKLNQRFAKRKNHLFK